MKGYPMFKDLGVALLNNIPEHWEVVPLKSFVYINRRTLGEGTLPNLELKYIDIGNVNENGLIGSPQLLNFKDAPSRARRIVQQNDTIISTVRTYLKAIAFIEEDIDNLIASTGFAVLSPKQDTCPKYISYVLRSNAFISQVTAESKGASYPAITASELGRVKIAVVKSRTEQDIIVAYLDQKVTEINQIIEDREKLIALLKVQKVSIAERIVTRGLTSEVRFIPSGLRLLSEIPEHWKVKQARYYFRECDERSEAGDEELLSVSHITGVTPRSEKNVTMFMAESYEGYKICQPGDLVINIMWAWMGALGVSEYKGIVSSSYGVYRQKQKFFNWQYLDYLLRTRPYVNEFTARSTGIHSSRFRMYTEDFFGIPIVQPPLEEQERIVRYIEQQHAQIDLAISVAESEIDLIKEIRTTLISDVITGQIDLAHF